MKLLYISSSNIWGGASVALYNIIDYMSSQGHKVYVFTVPKKGRLLDELAKQSVTCYESKIPYQLNIWPKTNNPLKFVKRILVLLFRNRKASKELEEIILRIHPDIVHTNVGPLDIALNICIRLGIPHVWHLREYQDMDFNMHFIPSQFFFRKKIKFEGNYNLAITKDIFKYWNLRDDIDRVVYDGVFSEKLLPIPNVETKDNYILFVGRIEPAKSPLLLIRAYKNYLEKYKNHHIKLKIAGTLAPTQTDYIDKCKNFIDANGLSNMVEWLGERKDVYSLMSRALCLVVPSRKEGFGFITVEAMLNHCPVVGRMEGGTKEQLLNGIEYAGTPIAISFNNESELTDALHTVLVNDMTLMIDNAYDMVTTHYTNEICGRKIETFYQQILNQKENHRE